jgi:hypothetical protein
MQHGDIDQKIPSLRLCWLFTLSESPFSHLEEVNPTASFIGLLDKSVYVKCLTEYRAHRRGVALL